MDTGPAPNALQAYEWIARPGAQKTTAADTVTQATYYDYDLDGNVKNLYQQVAGLGIKRINYEYDLISGKVNFVAYQNGKPDQFYYQYQYDADNRITQAWTGIKADTSTYGFGSTLDSATQKMDASYQYYLHGPLARMELGDINTKVQGVDYAYTLQGWLKGVNSQILNANLDMGQDSATVAKDAYGYSLGYYTNDYKPIGGTSYTAFANQYTQNTGDITGQSLYNGNISTSTYAILNINSGNPVGYTYHYDQLNRIKHLRQHSSITSWSHSDINSGYSEDFTFDGNGNILSLLRSGTTSAIKDSLIYKYNLSGGRLTNNQLNWLSGHGAATNMGTDQAANNYKYDPIGNLTDDAQARVDSIHWSVYGKITDMLDSTKTIAYKYNTTQERVSKTANGLTTYYLRDAQGNTLALYDNKASQVNWREQHLYGSSRLGMWLPNVNLATNNAAIVWDTIGKKSYELNNHLGNVMVTITDVRTSHTGYYTPNIIASQDYYAFGALMPGRNNSSNTYRYGFNGKENDNEVKGTGNQQDYGMRVYDPRVGRFLSIDPLTRKFPDLAPYQFARNSPVANIDLDGEENLYYQITHDEKTGSAIIKKETTHFPLEKIMPVNVYISIDKSDYFYEGSFALSFESQRKMLNQVILNYSKNPKAALEYLVESKTAADQRNKEDEEFWQNIWVEGYTTAWAVNRTAQQSSVKSPEANQPEPQVQIKKATQIPQEAINASEYAAKKGGAAQPGYAGGRIFSNDGRDGGQILPTLEANQTPITYREYDIYPKVKGQNRGTNRVVIGSNGKSYYTNDHYTTFTEIKNNGNGKHK